MSAFKPSARLLLGGEEYKLVMGFGEVAEFEKSIGGKSFMEAFGGIPSIEAVIKFVTIGLRWQKGRRGVSDRWVASQFDNNPAEFQGAVEAIAELITQFFPDAKEEEGSQKDPPAPGVSIGMT